MLQFYNHGDKQMRLWVRSRPTSLLGSPIHVLATTLQLEGTRARLGSAQTSRAVQLNDIASASCSAAKSAAAAASSKTEPLVGIVGSMLIFLKYSSFQTFVVCL